MKPQFDTISMQIGSQVRSKLYGPKGIGTIIAFTELFNDRFAEILFKDGSTVRRVGFYPTS